MQLSTRTHTCDMVLSASFSDRPEPTMQLSLYTHSHLWHCAECQSFWPSGAYYATAPLLVTVESLSSATLTGYDNRHLSHSRLLQQWPGLQYQVLNNFLTFKRAHDFVKPQRLHQEKIFSVIKTSILNENLFQWQTDMFYNYMDFL